MNVHSLLDKVIHTLAGIGIFSVFIFSCLSIAINIASPGSRWHMIALVLICLYAYVHKKFHIEKDLLYLGEAAFFSAQWASAESLVWQLFFGYSEVFHLLGYPSLIVVPIPFGLLGSYRFKKGRMKTFSKIFSLAASINLLVTVPLHMLGIVEFHYTMKSTHILIVIMLPLIACLLLSYTHEDHIKGHRTLSYPAIIVLTISVLMALSKDYFGTHGRR